MILSWQFGRRTPEQQRECLEHMAAYGMSEHNTAALFGSPVRVVREATHRLPAACSRQARIVSQARSAPALCNMSRLERRIHAQTRATSEGPAGKWRVLTETSFAGISNPEPPQWAEHRGRGSFRNGH